MKTEIKKLDSLSHNDTAATKTINDNFAALQKGIEDSLSRTGKTPNFMDAEFDMNSKRIINVSNPVNETDAVNYGTYKKHIDQAIDAAQKAAVSANSSQNSAVAARQYARQAKASRDEAVEAAEEAKETVETGKTDLDNIINEGMVEISDAIDAGKEDLNQIIEDGSQLLTEGKEELGAIIEDGKEELNNIIDDVEFSNYYTKTDSDDRYIRKTYYLSRKAYVDEVTDTFIPTWEPQDLPEDIGYNTGGWFKVDNMGEYKYVRRCVSAYLYFNDREKYRTAIVAFDLKSALSGNFAPVAQFRAVRPDSNNSSEDWYGVDIFCKELPTEPYSLTVTYI